MKRRLHLGGMTLLLLLSGISFECHAQEKAELAKKAKQILVTNCYRCHGQDGSAEGGMNFILNRDRLVATKAIIPGDSARSVLFKRVKNGEMPEDGMELSQSDKTSLQAWIDAGAADFAPSTPARPFISDSVILRHISGDVSNVPERSRQYTRYFTITHLFNAGLSDDELQTYRHGLSKLINSLSWGRRIAVPQPIDSEKTILRIDIRDYKWNENKAWDQVLLQYPYGVIYDTQTAKYCYSTTKSPLPYIRADWFVAAAAQPPLYHAVLNLPNDIKDLERRLIVDVDANLRAEKVSRAGFGRSGVSSNNRMIERHDSAYGAYWKSYDFAGNVGRQNIFAHPIGPGGTNGFAHDGGEVIFNLPNGLQAYMLIDKLGKRIDKGPTNIVLDPKQADSAVVNGLSCMSCHNRGMIEKNDQVRAHVRANRVGFTKSELESIEAIYPGSEILAAAFKEDAARFANAVSQTGAPLSKTEPVYALARHFEEQLDLSLAAAEAGVTRQSFLAGLKRSPELSRTLGVLAIADGTVSRDTFDSNFPSVASQITNGTLFEKRHISVVAYYNRGKKYYAEEQYKLAIANLSDAIRLDAEYEDAFQLRGDSYHKLDQYLAAKADYEMVGNLKRKRLGIIPTPVKVTKSKPNESKEPIVVRSSKEIYDVLMRTIEADLVTQSLPGLDKKYSTESREDKAKRFDRYSLAFTTYDALACEFQHGYRAASMRRVLDIIRTKMNEPGLDPKVKAEKLQEIIQHFSKRRRDGDLVEHQDFVKELEAIPGFKWLP